MTAQTEEPDWPYLTQISGLLGIDNRTATKCLEKLGYQPTLVMRGKRPLKAYPPESVEALRQYRQADQSGTWLTTNDIAKLVSRSDNWCLKQLAKLGITPQNRLHPCGRILPHYPPSSAAALKLLTEARPEIEDWLTFPQLAELTGTEPQWIRRQLERLGIGYETRLKRNKPVRCAPPEAADQLLQARREQLETPEAGEWLSITALAEQTGRHYDTVENQLEALGIVGEPRRDAFNRISPCYPPETAQTLLELEAPPADDWLPLYILKDQLGLSQERTKNLLQQAGISGQLRQAPKTRGVHAYYPPNSRELIREAFPDLAPPAGDWLSSWAISKKVMRTHVWVAGRLDSFKGVSQLRQPAAGGPPCRHYPPWVVEEIADSTPSAGDWLSTSAIAAELGTYYNRAKELLEPYRHKAEHRRPRSGPQTLHYPPEVLISLRYNDEVVPADPVRQALDNWISRNDIPYREAGKVVGKRNFEDLQTAKFLPRRQAKQILETLLSPPKVWLQF